MALGAVVIEVIADMIWIAGTAKIRLVAGKTFCRSIIVTGAVTLCTIQGNMRSTERKISIGMIKISRLPGTGTVAG